MRRRMCDSNARQYNLHAVRGVLNQEQQLGTQRHKLSNYLIFKLDSVLETSMSGPHHYFGFLDPRQAFVVSLLGTLDRTTFCPRFSLIPNVDVALISTRQSQSLLPVPVDSVTRVDAFRWIHGRDVTPQMMSRYQVCLFRNPFPSQ